MAGSEVLFFPDCMAFIRSRPATIPSHASFSTRISCRPCFSTPAESLEVSLGICDGPIPSVGGTKSGRGAIIEEGDIFRRRR